MAELTYNLVEGLGNFSDDPKVEEQLQYLAVNHPDVNIARKAAEKIGLEIVRKTKKTDLRHSIRVKNFIQWSL